MRFPAVERQSVAAGRPVFAAAAVTVRAVRECAVRECSAVVAEREDGAGVLQLVGGSAVEVGGESAAVGGDVDDCSVGVDGVSRYRFTLRNSGSWPSTIVSLTIGSRNRVPPSGSSSGTSRPIREWFAWCRRRGWTAPPSVVDPAQPYLSRHQCPLPLHPPRMGRPPGGPPGLCRPGAHPDLLPGATGTAPEHSAHDNPCPRRAPSNTVDSRLNSPPPGHGRRASPPFTPR
jgi:hypothetical protein